MGLLELVSLIGEIVEASGRLDTQSGVGKCFVKFVNCSDNAFSVGSATVGVSINAISRLML
jgi:hypothetical protein